jgi:hypothetical protein
VLVSLCPGVPCALCVGVGLVCDAPGVSVHWHFLCPVSAWVSFGLAARVDAVAFVRSPLLALLCLLCYVSRHVYYTCISSGTLPYDNVCRHFGSSHILATRRTFTVFPHPTPPFDAEHRWKNRCWEVGILLLNLPGTIYSKFAVTNFISRPSNPFDFAMRSTLKLVEPIKQACGSTRVDNSRRWPTTFISRLADLRDVAAHAIHTNSFWPTLVGCACSGLSRTSIELRAPADSGRRCAHALF